MYPPLHTRDFSSRKENLQAFPTTTAADDGGMEENIDKIHTASKTCVFCMFVPSMEEAFFWRSGMEYLATFFGLDFGSFGVAGPLHMHMYTCMLYGLVFFKWIYLTSNNNKI